MRYLSLFSGIEAATVAWKPLGWQAVAFSEIEPFPCALLEQLYPDVPNVGDVTAHDWSQYRGRVACVVGGPPCQDFSIAGKWASLSGHRGQLSLAFVDTVHAIEPLWSLTENVPGWLSRKDNAFGQFLAKLVGEDAPICPPGGKWTDAGVVDGPKRTAAWRILDAQYFGLAQRRERVIVLSARGSGNWSCAAALFPVGEGMSRYPAPRRETGLRAAGALGTGASDGGGWRIGADEAAAEHIVAFALRGRDEGTVPEIHGDGSTVGALRSASGGSSRDYVAYGQSGHFGGFDENAPTLRANGGDVGPGSEVIAAYGGNNTSGLIDVHPCLSSSHTASGRQDFETETFLVFDPVQITSGQNRSNPQPSGPYHTLPADPQAPCIAGGYGVRRITPEEAEALQGFPRGYTAITYRGKIAADGNRYRALGNSMPIPVMRWIGERIQMVDDLCARLAA